jgi:general secretion pathway protein F
LSIHAQIIAGASFANSLEAHPEDFPSLYQATIAAGERTGDLCGVLNKLADYGEIHLRTLNKIKLAMLYPAILSAFSLCAVAGLLIFVFPDIAQIFLQSGKPLPWITTALITLSDFLRHYGLLMGMLIVIGSGIFRRALANPKILMGLHEKLLRVPLAGKLILGVNLARFTNTLSMLRSSGLPLTEAVHIASQVLSNRMLRKAAAQARSDVIGGSSLSQALTNVKCFPASFISLIAGGEASGELDRVLVLAARNQMRELEGRILFGVAILEPVIILLMGLMVLVVVLAIMMPILSINQLVQ